MDPREEAEPSEGAVVTTDDTPLSVPDSPSLSDLTDAERMHPLFRRGYALGYAHRAHEESFAEWDQRDPRPLRSSRTTPPRGYGVTSGGLLGRLAPGVRVERDLLAVTDKDFTTETPCCGRGITLLIPDDDQTRPAACCRCRISYQVDLIQEEPDGYSDEPPPHIAVFVVEHLDVAMARHRVGTWEPTTRHTRPPAAGR
jgi:hypothetical protein